MNKFYIGQKIVAIKDHSQGIFKKGDEFTVLGVKKMCHENNIDVGFKTNLYYHECQCGKYLQNNSIHYVSQDMFATIELSSTTFEDVIKQFEPCLN